MSVFYKKICLASQFSSIHAMSCNDKDNDLLEALTVIFTMQQECFKHPSINSSQLQKPKLNKDASTAQKQWK